MNISHLTPTFADIKTWVRSAALSVNQLITGKQDKSDNLTSLAGLDLASHSGDVIAVVAGEDGFELVAQASGGSGISDGDYGDITVSGTGTVLTVDNDAVTYAKIQNVSATDKLLGRSTAGAGNIEEIACTAAGRALIDDATTGDQLTTLGLSANGKSLVTAADYAAMKALLDLEIGTDVQAYNALLAAIVGLGSNGLVARTAAGTAAARSIAASGYGLSVTNADGASGNPTVTNTFGGVMVKKSADQTGANYSASANIAWDAEVYDTISAHDNATNNTRLTTPAGASYVQVGCSLRLVNVTIGNSVSILLSKSGTTAFDGAVSYVDTNGQTNPRYSFTSGPIPVTGGTDYFEVALTCADTSIDITASVSNFWMRVVG